MQSGAVVCGALDRPEARRLAAAPTPMNCRFLPKSALRVIDFFRSTTYNMESAQAVYAVFLGPNSEKVKNAPLFCGSKGLCGAVYAAVDLRPDLEDIIIQEFRTQAGECLCEEIRAEGKIPCHQCVQLACQVLEDYLVEYREEREVLWYEKIPNVEQQLGIK